MTLAVNGVSVSFGTMQALHGVTLSAEPGERLAVIGPNGAGKTTLLDAIGGLVRPSAGRITFNGTALSGLAPEAVARHGVARTFQSARLFPHLTLSANIRCGRRLDTAPWLELAGLSSRRRELALALTPGEARRLELARALAGDPRLLLLDEPCGGLSAGETEAMAALIERATVPGRIVVLVEHKLGVVRRLCERAVVLHLGETIFDGPSRSLPADPRVIAAYLGRARTA